MSSSVRPYAPTITRQEALKQLKARGIDPSAPCNPSTFRPNSNYFSNISLNDDAVTTEKMMDNAYGCQHKWKTYTGFTDVFDYCTKCDERR